MNYKVISKIIYKDELEKNRFIKEEFVLKREYDNNLKLIHGVVINDNNQRVKDCAVLLQCKTKYQKDFEDLSINYTNENGVFGFQVKIDSNKEYRFLIFSPNKINSKEWFNGQIW